MWVQMRYVVAKRNRDGTLRWYWQRRSFPTKRLPDDQGERLSVTAALNERADAEKRGDTGPAEPAFGTIAWAVTEYKHSPKFARLSVSTRKVYDRWLLSLSKTVGHQPITALTPKAVYDIIDGVQSIGAKSHVAAVLSAIAKLAIKRGLLDRNPAQSLDLAQSRRRDQLWSDADVASFLETCQGEPMGKAIALGLTILLFSAQRPGDMRSMTWNQYDGNVIRIRQQKTGKLVDIPCHSELRRALDAAKTKAKGTHIVTRPDGRPVSEFLWREHFNRCRSKAGLMHLQARDLRRTAAVRLAEAGATTPEIAAVTGHTIDRTQRILETYLPRTKRMAQSAIAKLEEYRS